MRLSNPLSRLCLLVSQRQRRCAHSLRLHSLCTLPLPSARSSSRCLQIYLLRRPPSSTDNHRTWRRRGSWRSSSSSPRRRSRPLPPTLLTYAPLIDDAALCPCCGHLLSRVSVPFLPLSFFLLY